MTAEAPLKITEPFAVAIWGVVSGFLALVFTLVLRKAINGQKIGKDVNLPKLDFLADQIRSGSYAFLRIEYKYLSFFVAFLAIVLVVMFTLKPIPECTGALVVQEAAGQQIFTCSTGKYSEDASDGVRVMGAFLVGALLSGAAGWGGMSVATLGNVRTTVACATGSMNDGLKSAFQSGAVMGFTVVGLGLSGLSLMYWLLTAGDRSNPAVFEMLAGFGVGASSIALFARVAGGIYTKAADVGADLVGKVEAGIDEDDPHNPAVIADNVGDNVGDVAGMGADLFESYVGSIIAACALAGSDPQRIALPFALASIGIVCSMVGYFAVGTKEEGKGWDVHLGTLMWALERGMYLAGTLYVGLSAVAIYLLGGSESFPYSEAWKVYACVIIGLVSGMSIGKVTEYFTSFDFGPVISIMERGRTGPATVVIQGIGVGMISCAPPTIILVLTILICDALSGQYGVAIAAVSMLATLGITLATDAYGPVADNAGGLAEMAGLGPDVRAKTDSLDALGNTTAATGKGFAIGSAVLTALSLMNAFKQKVTSCPNVIVTRSVDGSLVQSTEPECTLVFDISDATVMSGALFGAMLPFLFAAMTMISVGKAAAEIIEEVRRQFREIPGLRNAIEKASEGIEIPPEEDVLPDSDLCVAISTQSSVKEMIAPGAYAILGPIFVGFTVGPKALMGMLAGGITSGAMVAIMMSNAGGAWDNSKKLCEKMKLKKTEQGKACVIGDTVGDPFKDTSGPALNILIKLMSMVSLLIAPILKNNEDFKDWWAGMIPLGLFVIITAVLMYAKIITWKDPLAEHLAAEQESKSPSTKIEVAEGQPLATTPTAQGKPVEPASVEVSNVI